MYTKFFLAVTVLGLAGMFAVGALGLGKYSLVCKMIASTGFIAMAVAAGGLETAYGKAVLLGLFFSWWGDLFLGMSGWFLFGLVAFLLGHLCYSAAFLVHGVDWKWVGTAALGVAVVAGGVSVWLGDKPGELLYPVYAYMLVISSMVALSFGTRGLGASWWLVAAAVLFYVSDLFVARSRFVSPGAINGVFGLPLYYGGQIVFAYTCRLVAMSKGVAGQ